MKSALSYGMSLALVAGAAGLGFGVLQSACGPASGNTDAGGADAGGAPTCTSYCTAIMANCTQANGNLQYDDTAHCIASCAAMPLGTSSDTSGNTVGCRTYHAGLAQADPNTHCKHAGPGGFGVCGADCAGFCQIAMMYCVPPDAGVYTSLTDCQNTCGKFPDDAGFWNVTDTSLQATAQVGCLLYHVQEASIDPPDHCLGDIKTDGIHLSTTCNNGDDAGL